MSVIEPLGPLPLPEIFRDEVFRIETRRLWLRWPMAADAQPLEALVAIEAAAARRAGHAPHPFLGGPAVDLIAAARLSNAIGGGLVFALTIKTRPQEMIGLVGLEVGKDGGLVVCFMLDVAHQGQGLMTEAMRALAATVFSFAPHRVIRSPSGVSNVAARRVLEKSGFAVSGGHQAVVEPEDGAPQRRLELKRDRWRRMAPTALAA